MAFSAATLLVLLLGASALLFVAEREDDATFSDALRTRRQREAAVLFSGDAGFLGVGPEIARAVELQGLPVYGVSSLAEFRQRRTISQTVAIVDQAVRTARAKFGADRILLIGHSFGSDVIGTALPDLTPDVRQALSGRFPLRIRRARRHRPMHDVGQWPDDGVEHGRPPLEDGGGASQLPCPQYGDDADVAGRGPYSLWAAVGLHYVLQGAPVGPVPRG